jgi:hypothetical protein
MPIRTSSHVFLALPLEEGKGCGLFIPITFICDLWPELVEMSFRCTLIQVKKELRTPTIMIML